MSTTLDHQANGEEAPSKAQQPCVRISVTDVTSFSLHLEIDCYSLDYALNMLASATRELEAQWRLQRAEKYQQAQVRALEDQRIRQTLQRKM
jgi:hypothetical protein